MPNPRAQKNANLRSTATGIYDAVTQGLLPMLGNAARGSVAATLGAPGDILGLLSDKQPLPTSQNILDYIPAAGSDKNVIGMAETMGGFVPTPGSSGLARVAKTALTPSTYQKAFMQAQAPAVMSPITAWHGSPHKFDKFDNSKMGTGEGAQVYGAGAYLADARPVAEEYKKVLSQGLDRPVQIDGVPTESKVARQIAERYINPEYYIRDMGKKLENLKANLPNKSKEDVLGIGLSDFDVYSMEIRGVERDLQEAQSLLGKKINKGDPGYLYKADIPDEAVANMLLWDKPLSEQPEMVRKAVKDYAELAGMQHYTPERSSAPVVLDEGISPDTRGRDIYQWLTSKSNPINASSDLKAFGVPGIRYLDQGSRGAGQGTMNTVVFDDSLIKILERNGVPMNGLLD